MRERRQTMRLAAAESLKENHRYTTSNKISMCPPLVFVEARETLPVHPDGLSAQELGGWGCAVGRVGCCIFFSLYRNVRKVKRLFIGGAASLDTR